VPHTLSELLVGSVTSNCPAALHSPQLAHSGLKWLAVDMNVDGGHEEHVRSASVRALATNIPAGHDSCCSQLVY
jgi:hypothetical protein